MITISEILFLAPAGVFLLYLALLSVLALLAQPKRSFETHSIRRFAIVVPAHNEELSIERTLRSLFAIKYPREYFDVVVIADNCNDRTADLARSQKADVYERVNPIQRGKGYALRWCFDQLLIQQPAYDAIVVIDADSVASANFLSVMNYYIENGSAAIQCSDMVEPQPESWSSEITRLGFTLYNHVRPLGRSVIGCSAGVRGNGMCFTTEILRTIPWDTYSLNEDLEYGFVLLLQGKTVDFAPEANVWATMPSTAKNAESQRARWEQGRIPVIRRYGLKLLKAACLHRSFRHFDAFVELITPPFVNLFGSVVGMLCTNLVLWQIDLPHAALYSVLWLSLLLLGITHVLLGLYATGADALQYKAFFFIPRYALWKFLLYTRVLRRGQTEEWVRTERDHSVTSDLLSDHIKQ